MTGASRGLGAAIARTLGSRGFLVAVNYWDDAAEADAVVGGIVDAGGRAAAFGADATDEAEVSRLVADIGRNLGPIDVLVVNATGPQPEIALTDLSWADVSAQLDYFARSPLLLTQAVVPGMRERGWGRIVHIGSDATDRAIPTLPAYVTAKAAQLGLAAVSARTLGPWGITVNTVAPGWIPVERHARSARRSATRTSPRYRSAGWEYRPTSRRPSPSSPPTIPPSSRGNASWSTGARSPVSQRTAG